MSLVQNLTEKQELLIGTAVFALCNATFFVASDLSLLYNFDYLVGSIIAAAIGAFIFYTHEFIHLWVAKRKRIHINFRIMQEMTFLSLVTAILPLSFKFIAPGMIFTDSYSTLDDDNNIIIYLAGPITTLYIASILIISIEFLDPGNPILILVFLLSARMALLLTLFSLIPFFFFDGEAIFKWNKFIWGGLFSLTLVSMIILGGII